MMTVLTNIFSCKVLYNNDEIVRILNEGSNKQTNELEEKANLLAEKMGVRKKIELVIHPIAKWKALGRNSSTGRVGICVDPAIFDQRTVVYYCPDAISFKLAREIAHIKYNDEVLLFVIPLIASIAFFILFTFYIPLFPANFALNFIVADAIGFTAWMISSMITRHAVELSADFEACKYTTDAEKLGFIIESKVIQRKLLIYRDQKDLSFFESLWRKIKIDSEGNNGFDTLPDLSTRIKKIEETMKIKPTSTDFISSFIKQYRNDKRVSFSEHRLRIRKFGKEGRIRSANEISSENRKEYLKMPFYPLLWLKYHYSS